MKLFVIAFLAIAAVSGSPVEKRDTSCIPGTMVKQDCNTCMCTSDGTALVCTLMLCESSSSAIENTRVRREAPEKVCTPGETKMEKCNSCFCVKDGSGWGCTMMACLQICEPGTQYKKYCNTCSCSRDGSSEICTRKACPKNVFNEDGSLVSPLENGSKNAL